MGYWYNMIIEGLDYILSLAVALLRFAMLVPCIILTGLINILFNKVEIVNVDFKVVSYRCDTKNALNKLSFIDKLEVENPDLSPVTKDDEEEIEVNLDDILDDEDEDEDEDN